MLFLVSPVAGFKLELSLGPTPNISKAGKMSADESRDPYKELHVMHADRLHKHLDSQAIVTLRSDLSLLFL